eukprot:7014925-Pyramimonas_sp.AAC.1
MQEPSVCYDILPTWEKCRPRLRAPLAEALPAYAGGAQYGGIAGRGVDLAALAIRSFQELAQTLK